MSVSLNIVWTFHNEWTSKNGPKLHGLSMYVQKSETTLYLCTFQSNQPLSTSYSFLGRYFNISILASDLKKSTGVSVHPSTIRRQLSTMVLKGCVAVKKPLHRKRKGLKRRKITNQRSCCCSKNNRLTTPEARPQHHWMCLGLLWSWEAENTTSF